MENTTVEMVIPKGTSKSYAMAVVITAALSLLCLLLLHFASPEFEPSWRMASEYALGNYQWLLTLFFLFWGVSSVCLAILLWRFVSNKAGKAGVILVFISGIGEILASIFDVTHSLHGLAALLGVPTLPIAALLVSYHLKSKEWWSPYKKSLLRSAHFTWISVVVMIIAMVVMMMGFQQAGIEFKEGSEPPKSVPGNVIALGRLCQQDFHCNLYCMADKFGQDIQQDSTYKLAGYGKIKAKKY